MNDDFCQAHGSHEPYRPGRAASLSCSEVVTLAVFGQWAQFASERGFYRYAVSHLRPAFPTLPAREQFNRLQRQHREVIVAFSLYLVQQMQAQRCLYEALDSSGIPTRHAKRRGTGWLAGQADIGWSNRIGWYEGFHLLCAINPQGVITGFGFAAASTHDQPLAETFFAARALPTGALASVGSKAQGSISLIRAKPERSPIPTGGSAPEPKSSRLRISAARRSGPKRGDAGWLVCDRSSKPFTTNCSLPSAWLANGLTI